MAGLPCPEKLGRPSPPYSKGAYPPLGAGQGRTATDFSGGPGTGQPACPTSALDSCHFCPANLREHPSMLGGRDGSGVFGSHPPKGLCRDGQLPSSWKGSSRGCPTKRGWTSERFGKPLLFVAVRHADAGFGRRALRLLAKGAPALLGGNTAGVSDACCTRKGLAFITGLGAVRAQFLMEIKSHALFWKALMLCFFFSTC